MKYRRLYSLFLVLLFTFPLTSCSDPSAGKYASACSLFGEGRVYEAKNIFITIPEYEDASAYLAYIEAADKEAAQEYAGAAAIFDSLADFRDSRDRAKYWAIASCLVGRAVISDVVGANVEP